VGYHHGYAWRVIGRRDGTLASCGRDSQVRAWPGESRTLGLGSITALVEDSRARLWCGTRSGLIARLDDTGVRIAERDVGAVLAIAADASGIVAATARGEVIAIAHDGRARWTRHAHVGWAWNVVPHRSGVLSCGEDGRIVATDADGATRVLANLGVPLRALAARGDVIVAGDTDGMLHVSCGDTHASWRAHKTAVTSIVALDDGAIVSASEDGRVVRWTGECGEVIAALDNFVTSLAVLPGGALVCAGYDGAIRRL
jgi:ligand-binding sensor domain-containing protein